MHLARVERDGTVTGLHQEGVMFTFPRHTGELRGRVKFEWTSGHRVLGQVQEITTHGHPGADFGDPTHYTAARCTIRRSRPQSRT